MTTGTPGFMPRWRSGPSLGAWENSCPHTDEDYVDYYQDRVNLRQARQLLPLIEDLADWLNKTLGLDHLTPANLVDLLDNGVILCHLARVIQDRALEAVHSGLATGIPPVIKGRCFENAARRSFFSRDNTDKFIQFCRQLGVHQNLLFESDDLVLQNNPRNVILCLMEVARIASRFNMEPPGLIALEKEIAEEESQDSGMSQNTVVSWQFQPTITPNAKIMRHSSSSSALTGWNKTIVDRRSLVIEGEPEQIRRIMPENGADNYSTPQLTGGGTSDGVPSDTTEDDWSRGSGEDPDMEIEQPLTPMRRSITDLDRKVQHVTRVAQKHCHCAEGKCEKLKVKKVGEGKYNIAGRNVFVRLLKGRHMMVRVGGGWDTLEHFLQRHDPCQVRGGVVSRAASPVPNTPSKFLRHSTPFRSSTPDSVGR